MLFDERWQLGLHSILKGWGEDELEWRVGMAEKLDTGEKTNTFSLMWMQSQTPCPILFEIENFSMSYNESSLSY